MQLFKNNARSTLAASLATGVTTLTVATGEGARFPVISGGDYFLATIEDATTVEIVKVTARATDTLTIERQQEGTTSPATFASGAVISLRLTAAVVETMVNHVADTDAAHAASAIANTPSGNLTATDVQAALNELQADVDTLATSAALTAHVDDTTAAHAASAIASTPSGNLAATDVQAALNELDTEKEPADANIAKINVEQTWTAQQTPMTSSVTTSGSSQAWDCDVSGQVFDVTMGTDIGGTLTLSAPTNVINKAFYVLRVTQNASAARGISWNAAYKFPGGSVKPLLTSVVDAVDIFSFIGGPGNTMHCLGYTKDVK